MNLGISILFKVHFVANNVYLTFQDLDDEELILQVPETQETKLFSFLNPLAVEIWIFVFFAYCLVISFNSRMA